MPDYVLNRNHTLRTTHGHIINFVKGMPVYVPPIVEKDALHIGAQPVDGPKDVLDDEPVAEVEPQGEDRKALVFAAFDTLTKRNARDDFSGQGLPNAKALEKLLGFKMETRERDTLWQEYKQSDE